MHEISGSSARVRIHFVQPAILIGLALALVCTSRSYAQVHPRGLTQVQAQGQVPGNPVAPAAASLEISSGDLLTVDVFGTPELSGKFRVSQAGDIALQQAGPVHIAGMSAIQAGQAIERQLRDAQIMLDPHVSVFVQEYASQGVIVLGEVNHPGTYTLLGEHSLYGALAAAGGATGNEGSTITVTHQNDPNGKEVIRVDSPNYSDLQRSTRVNPGDTVFVSRGELVYVYGSVGRPGAFPIRAGQPLNVLEVLSLAQGLEHPAASRYASILRQTPTGMTIIPVDLKTIYKQGGTNPVLQASDIVVVPRDGVKAILYTAIPAIVSATASAVIYSGLN